MGIRLWGSSQPHIVLGLGTMMVLSVGVHAMGFALPSLLLFETTPLNRVEAVRDAALEQERQPILICRQCKALISEDRFRMSVGGNHEHSFFNPQGIIYRIGCFEQAQGCGLVGTASNHFSWFPGYTWVISCCKQCDLHMGWAFQRDRATFFGLILANLAEAER